MSGPASKFFCRRCATWVAGDHVHATREREGAPQPVGRLPGTGLLGTGSGIATAGSAREERVRGRLEPGPSLKTRSLDGRVVQDGTTLELLLPGGRWVEGTFRGGESSTPVLEIVLGGSWERSRGREEPVTAFVTLPDDAVLRWHERERARERERDPAAPEVIHDRGRDEDEYGE